MSPRLIEIHRRFSDPAYAPNWRVEDRPRWQSLGAGQKRLFSDFVIIRLAELELLVDDVLMPDVEAALPEIGSKIIEAMSSINRTIRHWQRDFPDLSSNDLAKRERRMDERLERGTTRRGPTKTTPGQRLSLPAAQAAWDMWRIRQVIFPRFWPEEAASRSKRDELEVAKIAALCHPGCSPQEARSWFKNERIGGR